MTEPEKKKIIFREKNKTKKTNMKGREGKTQGRKRARETESTFLDCARISNKQR